MVDVVRASADIQTLLLDNTSGLISEQDVRDATLSAYAWAGGRSSLKDFNSEIGQVKGDGATNDYAVLVSLLNASAGVPKSVPAATYRLTSSGSTITSTNILVGQCPADTIFDRNSASSGVSMFHMTASAKWSGLRFINGGVWMDFDTLTTELDYIEVDNCEFHDVRAPLRSDAISGVPAGAKISRFRFCNNIVSTSDTDRNRRGLYIAAHGVSDGLVSGNHVSDISRYGIHLGGTATPQADERNARNIIVCNIVKDIFPPTGTDSAFCKVSGSFFITALNHFDTFQFNGDAASTDVEGYYEKVKHSIVALNTFRNASGAGQGQITLKGGKRDGTVPNDGGPTGWNAVVLGNILIEDGSSYTQPDGIWIQKEDAVIIGNILDGVTGQGVRHQTEGYKNSVVAFCNFVDQGGTAFLTEGPHDACRWQGNTVEFTISSTGTAQTRMCSWRNQGDTRKNGRIQDNTVWHNAAWPTGGTGSIVELNSATSGAFNGLLITGEIYDGNSESIKGIEFVGNGAFNDVLISNCIFRDFDTAASVICSTSGTSTSTITILDNLGFANRAEADITITNGNTTGSLDVTTVLVVPTGFATTLNWDDIEFIAPKANSPQQLWWPSISGSTLTINLAAGSSGSTVFRVRFWRRRWTLA